MRGGAGRGGVGQGRVGGAARDQGLIWESHCCPLQPGGGVQFEVGWLLHG
jgi:hypothetical protein